MRSPSWRLLQVNESARRRRRSSLTGQSHQLDRFSSINSGRERGNPQSSCPGRSAQAQRALEGFQASKANTVRPAAARTSAFPLVAMIPLHRKATQFLNEAAHKKAILLD